MAPPSTYVLAGAAGGVLAVLLATRSWRWWREASPVVIIVPGGGLTQDGRPTPWVRKRLERAAELYAERRRGGEACHVVALSGGTPHKPFPIDPESKFQVYEAEGNAKHLIRELGVAAEDVFEENWSLDTIANAYMLRTVHTDVAGWRRLVVVNNEFHMPRTRLIFDKVFALSPLPEFGSYDLEYVEVSNEGVEPDALSARKEREAKSADGFRKVATSITSLREMHAFLFRHHIAYASKRLLTDRAPIDPKALATY